LRHRRPKHGFGFENWQAPRDAPELRHTEGLRVASDLRHPEGSRVASDLFARLQIEIDYFLSNKLLSFLNKNDSS
jgi:hypothetical protein